MAGYPSINAPGARSLAVPPPKNLKIPLGRRLDAKMAKNLMSARPKRVPRDNGGGGFFPGMGEEMDETEVKVGYSDLGRWYGPNQRRPATSGMARTNRLAGLGDTTTAGSGTPGAATAAPAPIIKRVPNTPRHLVTQGTPTSISSVSGLGALHAAAHAAHAKTKHAAIVKHAAIKVHKLAPAHDGFMPGFGAFDMASLTSPKMLIGGALAFGAWYFLLRKKRRA
jgi:hypothetical protein